MPCKVDTLIPGLARSRREGLVVLTHDVGSSADYALAEAFNASLKRETFTGTHGQPDSATACRKVLAWITRDNTRHRRSSCGHRSPVAFENAYHVARAPSAA